jgi:outer membrane protein
MMKNSMLAMAIIGALIMANAGTAGAFGAEVAIGGWRQAPSGTLGYKVLDDGDILDLEHDLNYADETRLSARVSIDMPLFLPNIYLMATPMEFDATGQKDAAFNFGDVHFDPGQFYSETKLDSLDVALYYGIPFLETATFEKLNVDLGINVRIYDYKLNVYQASSGLSESESGILPIPMAFLAVQFSPIEELSFQVEGRGISYSGNDLYSIIARVKVNIFGPLFAAGGYRYEKLKLDEEDVEADVEFSGPFLEAGFSF